MTINVFFKNTTDIFPNYSLVKSLYITFSLKGLTVLCVNLMNYKNNFKYLTVNFEFIELTIHCIINKQQADFIKNKNLYDSVYIQADVSFKNIFNIQTHGIYRIFLDNPETSEDFKDSLSRILYNINYNSFEIINIEDLNNKTEY